MAAPAAPVPVNTFNQPITQAGGSIVPTTLATPVTPVVPTPTPATPTTITSSVLAPQSPVQYTTPNPTPIYPVSTLTPPAPAPATDQANDLTTQLENLNNELEGKSADQTAAENAAGLPALQATQRDLTAQLTGLTNEAQSIPLQLQTDATGRGITADGLAPIQSAALRNNAVQALTVSTLLAASNGNIATAQALADKAVAQKYDPIQEEITAATANLNLILQSPKYSAEQKAAAQAQLDAQNAKQAELDKAKANTTAVQQIAITAAQNGADAVTLKNISAAADPIAAVTAAGKFAQTAPDTTTITVNGRQLLINSKTGATIKDLGAAPAPAGRTLTQSEQQAGALASYASSFVPGATFNGSRGKTPILDTKGYFTAEGFKAAINDATAQGIPRATFLGQYGYLLATPGGTPSNAYGLTPVEVKLVTGAASS